MTTRLANALQRQRHLKGARVLCQKNGQPLRANMLAYLPERATRKAGLATGRKPRHAGPHVLRHHADSRIMPTSFGTRQIAVEIAHFETTRSA
jgi:hypothetical protein